MSVNNSQLNPHNFFPWQLYSLDSRLLSYDSCKVKVTLRLTVSQSVSLGVEPHLGLMTKYLLLFDSYGIVLFWGALSDERTGLYLVYAAGPCQASLYRVRVLWYSRPYFTVSDLRLPFSSPPTTRRVTGGGIRPRVHTGYSLSPQGSPLFFSPE
jgi:hypothetical protein